MKTIRGVLLDMDGTLVDTNDAHAHAWVEALAEVGVEVPFDKVRPLIGMGSDNLLPEVAQLEKESPKGKQASEAWGRIFEERYLPKVKPFPQARELVQRMHDAGLTIVMASSAKEKLLDALMETVGIKDLISEATSSDDAKRSKPDPDIIHAALEQIGLPAEAVLMVGDTPFDIEAAGKAGVGVIALRCGGWNNADLAGAVAIFEDPADLLARYDESPLAVQAAARAQR